MASFHRFAPAVVCGPLLRRLATLRAAASDIAAPGVSLRIHDQMRGGFKLGRHVLALLATAAVQCGPVQATMVSELDLVSNNQAIHPASIQDPNLVNAWGVSFSPGSPFWVSDNGTGKATLYSVNPSTNAVTQAGLVVSIPGNGTVSGQVFNPNPGAGASAFHGDNFLFVSEDGTISGWRGALGTTAEVLATGSAGNVYKGAALGAVSGVTYLYAANFAAAKIDVIPGTTGALLPGSFTDPALPAGYAPFNIQNLGGKLYVTYAKQDSAKHDEIAGLGNGFVSVFDLNGNFLGRVGSGGTLNAPWGLAIAPTSFGQLAGDLLVGNFGDGRINVFDTQTDTFIEQLSAMDGTPLAIDGLWALTVGNDANGGSSQKLYFSAGPDGEANGLFGVLTAAPQPTPVPEPASILLLAVGLIAALHANRRRNTCPTIRKPTRAR